MRYIIDTSAFLAGAEYGFYEKEYFNNIWINFDNKIQKGVIASTERVYHEIISKDDDISSWAKKNKKIFENPSQDILNIAANLHNRFPGWYKRNRKKKNWADSQVISFAKHHRIVLVTQEPWNWDSTKERNYKIPTICSKVGAYCHIRDRLDPEILGYNGFQCIDFLELIKREKLHE